MPTEFNFNDLFVESLTSRDEIVGARMFSVSSYVDNVLFVDTSTTFVSSPSGVFPLTGFPTGIFTRNISAVNATFFNLSGANVFVQSITANNLLLAGGNLGQVIVDNLSAYTFPVFIKELISPSITGNKIVIGVNSRVPNPNWTDTNIIGDNIVAPVSGFLYINSLSATGNLISRNINNLAIGLGAGNQESNLAIGISALNLNSLGSGNIAIGRNAQARTTTGVFSVSVTVPGVGYEFTPVIFVSGGGQRVFDTPTNTAVLSAVLSGGMFTTISAFPAFSINALSGHRSYSSTLSAITGINFIISRVVVIERGAGYFFTPTLTISGGSTDYQRLTGILNFQGASAVPILDTASNNITIGFNAGGTISLGSNNVLIGTNAGRDVINGDKNTVVGNGNILFPDANNNIVIGYDNYVGNFNNVILLGNNLSATKNNFAFMSALKVSYLEVDDADFAGFLNVSPGGLSASSMRVENLTATNLTIRNFDGKISITQLAVSGLGYEGGSQTGQTIVFTGSAWIPSFSITGYPGTRLFDFQTTAYDTGFNVVTADTTYCGVAPVLDNTSPAVSSNIWRVTRVIYNDGGSVQQAAVSVNIPWTSRYSATYAIINN